MDLSLPRGIRDIEPDEHRIHDEVRKSFESVAELNRFRLMDPAPIEHLATLRAKSGPDVDKEIYTFSDKGGRELGLRFDLTVGMTRYVCSRRDLKPPVKLACVGGVWRYEEPQHARYRWFKQWDLEIFGPPSIAADAEVIDASYQIFAGLGVKSCLVQVGDRRIVEEFIKKALGVASDEQAFELMRALDKVQKKPQNEILGEYTKKGFTAAKVKQLLDFGSIRGQPGQVLERLREHRLESVSELETLLESLKGRGIDQLEYNMSVVRGIDYYTAVVFEIVDRDKPELGTLCGGGRYDRLPSLFGRPDLSATGSAGGLERAALSIMGKGPASRRWVYVAQAGEGLHESVAQCLAKLRRAGVPAESDLQGRSISKQFDSARSMGASWVMVVGKREVKENKVTIRDMKTGEEKTLTFDEALKIVEGS